MIVILVVEINVRVMVHLNGVVIKMVIILILFLLKHHLLVVLFVGALKSILRRINKIENSIINIKLIRPLIKSMAFFIKKLKSITSSCKINPCTYFVKYVSYEYNDGSCMSWTSTPVLETYCSVNLENSLVIL
jgi:hypothetical protein